MEISRLVNMVKATIALIVLVCSAVMGTHGSPTEDEREAEIMRKYDGLSVHDRNLDQWKTEFTEAMEAYEAKLYMSGTTTINETQICDGDQELKDDLAAVKTAAETKQSGILLVQEQLGELEALLNDEKFAGITGLKTALQTYIDEHKEDNAADLATLGTELADITAKGAQIETYNCPCVYNDWSEWGDCSACTCTVTCGGGVEFRKRTIRRQPTNDGTTCAEVGNAEEPQNCNEDHCPIDCVFNDWAAWDMSPSGCSTACEEGIRTRERTSDPPQGDELYGGTPCDNEYSQTKPCNVLLEAQQEISAQETLISKIQACASDCDSDDTCGDPGVLPKKCG